MSVQDYYEELAIIEKVSTPGAFGETTTYIEKETIQGAVGTLSKREMLIAEANGNKSVYIVTVDKTNALEYDTIIKRAKNGQILRITSDWRDEVPPNISSFDWIQVNAEKFIIPN